MTPAHAVTMNGRTSFELKPLPGGGSVYDELRTLLSRLDGKDRFALLLWRLPDGVPFDLVDLDSEPQEYIQCAGGVAGRFTCEIRRLGLDGRASQEVIGRREAGGGSTQPDEFVHWAEHGTAVQRSEVLGFDELVELFESYLTSGEIPSSYGTRVLSV
jgi:hypothetical protein